MVLSVARVERSKTGKKPGNWVDAKVVEGDPYFEVIATDRSNRLDVCKASIRQ
jgi:hypothetical protein